MKTTVGHGPAWVDLVRGFSGSRAEVRGLVDYCRVFSVEDAMRWAMQAYLEASRMLAQSEGPWVDGGVPWGSPGGFVADFQYQFERRLWDARERSPRYREVAVWLEQRRADVLAARGESDVEGGPDLLRPQMLQLPPVGSVLKMPEIIGNSAGD